MVFRTLSNYPLLVSVRRDADGRHWLVILPIVAGGGSTPVYRSMLHITSMTSRFSVLGVYDGSWKLLDREILMKKASSDAWTDGFPTRWSAMSEALARVGAA